MRPKKYRIRPAFHQRLDLMAFKAQEGGGNLEFSSPYLNIGSEDK